MDFFKIDGKNYDVLVTAVEESFNILYSENTENNGVLLNNDKRLDQIEEIPIAARLMAETLYDYYIAAWPTQSKKPWEQPLEYCV